MFQLGLLSDSIRLQKYIITSTRKPEHTNGRQIIKIHKRDVIDYGEQQNDYGSKGREFSKRHEMMKEKKETQVRDEMDKKKLRGVRASPAAALN
jgi:hypothetical protein